MSGVPLYFFTMQSQHFDSMVFFFLNRTEHLPPPPLKTKKIPVNGQAAQRCPELSMQIAILHQQAYSTLCTYGSQKKQNKCSALASPDVALSFIYTHSSATKGGFAALVLRFGNTAYRRNFTIYCSKLINTCLLLNTFVLRCHNA